MTPEPPRPVQHQHPTRAAGPGQPSPLEQSYLAASYFVESPAGRLVIRIGAPHSGIDHLLLSRGCHTWAYVTAHNPLSKLLLPEENQRRQRDLEEEVSQSGRPFYRGAGVGLDDAWPAEQSVLILGISAPDALELAEKYGQAALVFGELGQAAQLLWTSQGLYNKQER